MNRLPDNYDQLNWCDKAECFDPLSLFVWQMNNGKLVPTAIEAATIKLWEPWPLKPNPVPRGGETYDQDAYNMHDLLKGGQRVD